MTKEELERKEKYDDMLEKYVHIIELGEDEYTYIKRICESMVSLGVSMCDFDKSVIYNLDFISHMLIHIHNGIMDIIVQCYQDEPTGETSVGHSNVDYLKKWRKDNGIS